MAEEPKDSPQAASMAANDATTESPPESKPQDAGSAGQEETVLNPATSKTTSMEPQDETFWEDSVDASTLNLADTGTEQGHKEEEGAAQAAPAEVSEDTTTGEATEEGSPDAAAPEAESTSDQSDEPPEQSAPLDEATEQPPSEDEPQQVKEGDEDVVAEKQEESATEAAPEAEKTPAEEPQAAESSGQVRAEDASPEGKETVEESAVENKEEGDEETAAVTVEEAPAESEVTVEAEKKEAEEENRKPVAETSEEPESRPREETTPQDTSELKESEAEKEEAVSPDDGAAEAAQARWYSSKKGMMIAAGILLLILGSVGYSVVPSFRSGDTAISTFFSGNPEHAYNMKFFLPLDVGYEEARFVKLTIAIELMDKGFKKEIDNNISTLRQEVIDLLLTKSPQEVKSSMGKKLLREEITSRLNHHLAKDCIKDTYFTELVIL